MNAPMTAQAIMQARDDNPKIRERDLAKTLGLSEAGFLEALLGRGVEKLRLDIPTFFEGIKLAGEVMALSRNEQAVHEKTGTYEQFHSHPHASMVLGSDIDLRISPKQFAHAYHVVKELEDGSQRWSFQFFDAHGEAVHKVFSRKTTDLAEWELLRQTLYIEDTTPTRFEDRVEAARDSNIATDEALAKLRSEWASMKDTHQFQRILRKSKLTRYEAISQVGAEFAWRLADDMLETLFEQLSTKQIPIMAFVRNPGILQIHSGTITNIKMMEPWPNVLDEGFHLHLRTDQTASVWCVRKPVKNGTIFSVEAFNDEGEQIILINGHRRECDDSAVVADWDALVHTLDRHSSYSHSAATV